MTLYEELGGFDKILSLCRRWHELCLNNPVAAHPFEHGLHPHHDERLAAYLTQAFGGPKLYTAGYGDESSVQDIHARNGAHIELDEICLQLFQEALRQEGHKSEVMARAFNYFEKATVAMRTYESHDAIVPDGLPFRYDS